MCPQFRKWLIAKLFYSVHKKLRTCGADFKYYEVADLRLWTSRFTKLRTCRCGLQELRRFTKSCGLAVRTSNITKLRTCGYGLQDLRSCGLQELRSYGFKNPETSLRTCGSG